IAVSNYTQPGDPMKIDFGYRVADELKFLQVVSMRASVDHAVVLAARFPAIAAGARNKHGAEASLIAVVEDDLDRKRDEVGFALGMLEENRIRVATTAELPSIAEQARLELRA
ncbi:MAG: DUF3037 domain-containing protein, partial [Terriglobales bacterium]